MYLASVRIPTDWEWYVSHTVTCKYNYICKEFLYHRVGTLYRYRDEPDVPLIKELWNHVSVRAASASVVASARPREQCECPSANILSCMRSM